MIMLQKTMLPSQTSILKTSMRNQIITAAIGLGGRQVGWQASGSGQASRDSQDSQTSQLVSKTYGSSVVKAKGIVLHNIVKNQVNRPHDYRTSSGIIAADSSGMLGRSSYRQSKAIDRQVKEVEAAKPAKSDQPAKPSQTQRGEGGVRLGWGMACMIASSRQARPGRKFWRWLKEWFLDTRLAKLRTTYLLAFPCYPYLPILAQRQLGSLNLRMNRDDVMIRANPKSTIRITSEGEGSTFRKKYFLQEGD